MHSKNKIVPIDNLSSKKDNKNYKSRKEKIKMKVFSVCGISKSGKTTTIEKIITELTSRGYKTGSVKDIHFEGFAIDSDGTNTQRHKIAGSRLVTARGISETDILYQENLPVKDILKHYNNGFDYVVLEGVSDFPCPVIVTGHTIDDVESKMNERTFLISGVISSDKEIFNDENSYKYKGIKSLNALSDIETIVDIIEAKVFDALPDFDSKCCKACGYDCYGFCAAVLKVELRRDDCVDRNKTISLKIDGKNIPMVPFVQKILQNAVNGVVKELDGYSEKAKIEICLGENEKREN